MPGGGLAKGDRVAIVSAQPVEPIQLPADQEDELVAALEDIRLGKYVDDQNCSSSLSLAGVGLGATMPLPDVALPESAFERT